MFDYHSPRCYFCKNLVEEEDNAYCMFEKCPYEKKGE